MRFRKGFFILAIWFLGTTSLGWAEDYNLQYFLSKASSKMSELSKKERTELLNRMNGILEEAERIRQKLILDIQAGELDIRYQEGKFWMSKLEEDQKSIQTGIEQLKFLKDKPAHLVASIKLYKSLKDLSSNFNAYNNMPSFCALVGDLAPEMELWVDPVFYQLYLLPLALLKDVETKPTLPSKEKKPVPKTRKP